MTPVPLSSSRDEAIAWIIAGAKISRQKARTELTFGFKQWGHPNNFGIYHNVANGLPGISPKVKMAAAVRLTAPNGDIATELITKARRANRALITDEGWVMLTDFSWRVRIDNQVHETSIFPADIPDQGRGGDTPSTKFAQNSQPLPDRKSANIDLRPPRVYVPQTKFEFIVGAYAAVAGPGTPKGWLGFIIGETELVTTTAPNVNVRFSTPHTPINGRPTINPVEPVPERIFEADVAVPAAFRKAANLFLQENDDPANPPQFPEN